MKPTVNIKILVIALGAVSVLAAAGVGAYFVVSRTGKEGDGQKIDEPTFSGIYVTADLPEGWTIIEYENGDGTRWLSEVSGYKGLTGLKVFNASGTEVFRMEAKYGIGSTIPSCNVYYQFADSDPDYYQQIIDTAAPFGIEPTPVDLTASTYSEYTFLEKRTRRVEDKLYWDTSPGTDTFDAACGDPLHIWDQEVLSFVVVDENEAEFETSEYRMTIAYGTSESDIEKLDGVLESIQKVEIVPVADKIKVHQTSLYL